MSAVTMVPVTPALAALLHQLQQEIAEAQHTPEPGSIVLAPAGPLRATRNDDANYVSAYADDWLTRVYLVRGRTNGGVWTGEESRRDDQGRTWERRIKAITDDFGNLVEVGK